MAATAAAPKGFEYEAAEAAGVKIATRDIPGPTTTLAVVAKAGSRYQPAAGFSDALSKFAFKVGWTLGRILFSAVMVREVANAVRNNIDNKQTVGFADHQRI